MTDLTLHCVQIDAAWLSPADNFDKVEGLLNLAPPTAGDVVLLAEMFATGFATEPEAAAPTGEAICTRLEALARRLKCWIVAGVALAEAEGPVNACLLHDPDGRRAGLYRKQRLFSFAGEHRHYRRGETGSVWKLAGWRAAPFVCYDLRFPELQRAAAGCELMCVVANWPTARIEHWRTLLRARAIENLCYVAAVNRCGSDPGNAYPGESMILDPRGETLAAAGTDPAVIRATLSRSALTDYRQAFPALDDAR